MLSRVASRVSMRSRERKLQLFLEVLQPGPGSSVLDVGVTNAPFGHGSTDNFFEALYPWPERLTAVGHTSLDRFAAAFPKVTAVQADGRDLPFADQAFDLGVLCENRAFAVEHQHAAESWDKVLRHVFEPTQVEHAQHHRADESEIELAVGAGHGLDLAT